MNKRHYGSLFALGCAALGLALFLAITAFLEAQRDKATFKVLMAKVERLESSRVELQQELSELRSKGQTGAFPPNHLLVAPPALAKEPKATLPRYLLPVPRANPSPTPKSVPGIPPGWQPFEFNGLTYYITPLAASPELSMNHVK